MVAPMCFPLLIRQKYYYSTFYILGTSIPLAFIKIQGGFVSPLAFQTNPGSVVKKSPDMILVVCKQVPVYVPKYCH
jgi:hypothetical protein